MTGMIVAVAISSVHVQRDAMTAVVTIAFALGLAARYSWVIHLLAWPATVTRITLLVAMWAAVDAIALNAGDRRAWAWSFVVVLLIGGATEAYNYATRQWAVGGPGFERSLRADHVRGAVSTVLAAATTAAVIMTTARYVAAFLAGLVLVDWLRLGEMVRRHRRFVKSSA